MNFIVLNYNNYFNRRLKKTDLNGYLALDNYVMTNFQMPVNDGITAKVKLSHHKKTAPNYLVITDDKNKIDSRWFVTEAIYTGVSCKGTLYNYDCTLKRDVIAEYYENIMTSPCFIEKGHVNESSKLIYNKEDFVPNQIKQKELLLRDKSYCSWIVLYYNLSEKSQLNGSVTTIQEPFIDTEEATIEDWDIYQKYAVNGYLKPSQKFFKVSYKAGKESPFVDNSITDQYDINCDWYGKSDYTEVNTSLKFGFGTPPLVCVRENKEQIASALENFGNPDTTWENFIKWNNKVVKAGNSFYRIRIVPDGTDGQIIPITSGALFIALQNAFKVGGEFKQGWSGDFTNAFTFVSWCYKYKIVFDSITNGVETYTYDFRNCQDIQDQPYGILALPYKTFDEYGRKLTFNGGYDVVEGLSMLIAKDLCKAGVGASSVIYDAQLLPYCPLDLTSNTFTKRIDCNVNSLESAEYTIVKNSQNYPSLFAIHPLSAKFNKNIDIRTLLVAFMPMEKTKIENQCTFYRLCSPNFNGQFEFNRAKNNDVEFINVDCTYKPYAPYIHLNPNFKGLYGQDFNDARGLICGGDFSISVISDSFEQYKLQNKNFNEIFNRQIENMDVNHEIQFAQNVANLSTSTARGVIGGAIAGGNPATIGLGTIAGLTSGITGMVAGEKNYQESRDYAIDNHNYQIGNIKALPDSLTKVDSYNNNNKIFPVLERYSCTDEEKEIFKQKIKFEGMTVNAIGQLQDYINPDEETFVKGKLLRIEIAEEDTHMLSYIYDEVSRGFYVE